MSTHRPTSFRDATDQIQTNADVTLRKVAERFGVAPGSLSRWRRESERSPPPENWREVLADMAAESAETFAKEAARLSALARSLR